MNNPKVTLALSVYNVEPYLWKSLVCIINQTFRDVEILCIDDCSKDGTYAILEEYAAKDDRIRLLKQPTNMGLSCSRNLAMAEARGEYILMLDGDDLFDPTMVEKAVAKAEETGADMVMWDYLVFYDESEIAPKLSEPSTLHGVKVSDRIALLKRPGFAWVRLLRMDAVRRLQLHFPEGLTKQDIPIHWTLCTQLSDEKIALIPERMAYYRQTSTNTTSRKGKSLYSLAKVLDIVGDYLNEKGLYATYRDEFWRSRLSTLQGMYDFIVPKYKQEALAMVKERLNDDAWEYIHSSRCELTSRTKAFYGMLEGNLIATLKYKGTMAVRWLYRKIKRRWK